MVKSSCLNYVIIAHCGHAVLVLWFELPADQDVTSISFINEITETTIISIINSSHCNKFDSFYSAGSNSRFTTYPCIALGKLVTSLPLGLL